MLKAHRWTITLYARTVCCSRGSAHRQSSGVALIAEAGEGPLTERELTAMARQYAAAREELRQVFEGLPEGEQAVGREVVRKLRAEDQARIRSGQEEAAAASRWRA